MRTCGWLREAQKKRIAHRACVFCVYLSLLKFTKKWIFLRTIFLREKCERLRARASRGGRTARTHREKKASSTAIFTAAFTYDGIGNHVLLHSLPHLPLSNNCADDCASLAKPVFEILRPRLNDAGYVKRQLIFPKNELVES